jgi:Rrf2 family protein
MLSQTILSVIKGLGVLAALPEGAFMGSAAVARRIGAREQYLGRLFQTLKSDGLVTSQKGLGGGVRLAKDATQITLFDIVDPLENVGRFEGCILGRHECSNEHPCPLHDRWKGLRDDYLELLKTTTLADVVANDAREVEGAVASALSLGTDLHSTKGELL